MEERSAGAVVFRVGADGARRFLLLLNAGHWDFPKGNMEEGESEVQTVLREVKEETGLDEITLVSGFRRVIEYYYRRGGVNVHKQVVYLLARTEGENVVISHEHQGSGWYPYDEARKRASYDNSRITLDEAEKFIVGT
jgi:8-oxo-dGTP pyrophosphatase MutT (NUDIX family)